MENRARTEFVSFVKIVSCKIFEIFFLGDLATILYFWAFLMFILALVRIISQLKSDLGFGFPTPGHSVVKFLSRLGFGFYPILWHCFVS